MAKNENSLKNQLTKKNKKEEQSFNGAIPINSYVKVKLNGEDKICKIISIRPDRKRNDEILNEYSYEYYIHYLEYNRRNDHWIKRKDILEKIKNEEELNKLNNNISKEKAIIYNNENEGLVNAQIKAHEEATKVRTIDEIVLGNNSCSTWYFSPFPEEYHNIKILYIGEFCLNFYIHKEELERHLNKNCLLHHPPGNEIYRDEKISIFEVDGKTETIYGQNLSYIAKLFLDHKTFESDVDIFLYYILTEYDKYGYHFVGYFSKEKKSKEGYNVACILVLPFHQRKGYGKFLIDFSYLLSRIENKFETPERSLSDLGFNNYFAYWTQKICETLKNWKGDSISINDIAEKTYIQNKDIKRVLNDLHLLRYDKGNYIIISDKKILEELEKRTGRKGYPLYPDKLIWTPYKY